MNRLQRALDTLVERVDTPAPIVLVDVMQDNIDRMQGFAAQHNLDVRPHVKTHKCVEIGRRQVEAGAVGITAGNVGEAEVFAAAGFDDIFLAYPIWPAGTKGTRIRRLAETTRLRVGVDNVAAVEALADAMGDEPDRLQVVVEVDCGARRSGAPPEVAGDLALAARKRGLVPVGVFTYPGHGSSGRDARKRAAQDQQAALTTAVRSLADVGVTAEVVSAGSTPTVEFSTSSVITEIRPGEYVFCDLDNTRLGACSEDQIALFVAATVVSDWVPDQVILDVGTKALGREGSPETRLRRRRRHEGRPGQAQRVPRIPRAARRRVPPQRRHRGTGGAQPRLPGRAQFRGADRHRQRGHVAAAVAGRRPRIPQLTAPGRDSRPPARNPPT